MTSEKIKRTCGKCNGEGYIKCYNHIAGGVCFACNGRGYFETTLKAKERNDARKKKLALERLEQYEIARREYNNKLYTFIEAVKDHPIFIELMKQCPSDNYYEQHASNALRYMTAKGYYKESV